MLFCSGGVASDNKRENRGIMGSENRLYFEAELLKKLKALATEFDGITATKNTLKFKHKKKYVANLYMDHIGRADCYVLAGSVYGGDLYECMLHHEPPYKSNLFHDACFSFISSGEKGRSFSGSMSGSISTPPPGRVEDICIHIVSALRNSYIPKIFSCITPTAQTVEGVLSSPSDYAYPAVFISCAASLGSSFDYREHINKAIVSGRIIKNKSYDIPLLSEFL